MNVFSSDPSPIHRQPCRTTTAGEATKAISTQRIRHLERSGSSCRCDCRTVQPTYIPEPLLAEWEAQRPGHFSMALFDHRQSDRSLEQRYARLMSSRLRARYAHMRWYRGVQKDSSVGRATQGLLQASKYVSGTVSNTFGTE